MGRRNRPKHPGREAFRGKGIRQDVRVPPIEEMVIPQGRCTLRHRKLKFTQKKATEALRQAQATREARNQPHVEKRIYQCDEAGGCGMWHLTSRESWAPRG